MDTYVDNGENLAFKNLTTTEFRFYEFGTNLAASPQLTKAITKFIFGTQCHVLETSHPEFITVTNLRVFDRHISKACSPPVKFSTQSIPLWSNPYVISEGSARARRSNTSQATQLPGIHFNRQPSGKVTMHKKHRFLMTRIKNREKGEER